eukprot:scaffold1807_cov140-Cylindrotheca_fusiformis.AAC.27
MLAFPFFTSDYLLCEKSPSYRVYVGSIRGSMYVEMVLLQRVTLAPRKQESVSLNGQKGGIPHSSICKSRWQSCDTHLEAKRCVLENSNVGILGQGKQHWKES